MKNIENFPTLPQDSSQQEISTVRSSCSDDERGGKVDKSNNSFKDTDLHEHKCRNCEVIFAYALPLCNGSWLDPELCPDCEEVLEGIW